MWCGGAVSKHRVRVWQVAHSGIGAGINHNHPRMAVALDVTMEHLRTGLMKASPWAFFIGDIPVKENGSKRFASPELCVGLTMGPPCHGAAICMLGSH